jgi:hypothetical protein
MIDTFELLEYTKEAKGIAFDTCHKIYILMDDEQMNLMKEYEYDPLISSEDMDAEEMANTLLEWYKGSCGLRFIQAVSTTTNPNDGYVDVVEQGSDWNAYEDEDEDEDD